MKNSLKAIILGTAIGLTGCSPSIYNYEGKIGNESISMSDYQTFNFLELTIIKGEGKVIRYYDDLKDGKLDSVSITKNGKEETFREDDKIGAEAFKIAQQQYTDYLAKILEIKRKQAVEDISN